MSVSINDLLNKSVQIQESVEDQDQSSTPDLSAFALNLEGVAMEQEVDMGSIRAALGAGMAINTVLEARNAEREEA